MQNIFNTFFLKQITIKYILNVCKMHGPRIQIFKLIWAGTAELLSFPLQISFNPFAPELFFLISAHSVYKT